MEKSVEAGPVPSSTDSAPPETKPQNAVKKPPPESPEQIRVRSLVILSFWATVIFLGLPVWWWTTSIHRARLPVQDMLSWADGKVCIHIFSQDSFIRPRWLIHRAFPGLQTDISPPDQDRCSVATGRRSTSFDPRYTACLG